MITNDFRFEGFDEASWLNLMSLLGVTPPERSDPVAVVVVDAGDRPIAAFDTAGNALDVSCYEAGGGLHAFCQLVGARRGIRVREGAIERFTQRAAAELHIPDSYAGQWLTLLKLIAQAEAEGGIAFHPARKLRPPPSAAVLQRAADLVLPQGRSLLIAIHERNALWTAVALRRDAGGIDRIVGPRTLLGWTGPLGGAYRRDHRVLTHSVEAHMAPVHLGIFAERAQFEQLLRYPAPGAWASAVATREVLIEPAPAYVGVAMAGDAARATASLLKRLLGGADPLGALAPVAAFARERVGHVASLTALLGFNPLHALSRRLEKRDQR